MALQGRRIGDSDGGGARGSAQHHSGAPTAEQRGDVNTASARLSRGGLAADAGLP